jgi:hypothetical protein
LDSTAIVIPRRVGTFGIRDVLVVRHTEALQAPINNEGVAEQMSQLIEEGVRGALVFVNASEGRAEFIGDSRVEALRPMQCSARKV